MKSPVRTLAAALSVLLCVAFASTAEARSHRRHGKRPAAERSSGNHKATARNARHGKPGRKAKGRAAAKAKPRDRRLIHQNERGEVIVDRVDPTGAVIAGPSRELFNYPPAPCEPQDVVLEARVHETATDAPEGDAPEGQSAAIPDEPVAGAAPAGGARERLTRIARKLGSLFRPKSSESEVKPQDVDLTELVSNRFMIPVEGVDSERLRDSFLSARGRHGHAKHLAIDIGAPRGTPILATTDGEITRIARERRGGKAIYQKDSSGQYLLFYCHLSKYADDLAVGRKVKKGEVIGYVGSTGHVIGGPHLHFSITRLPDGGESFKKGLAINPYLLFLAEVP